MVLTSLMNKPLLPVTSPLLPPLEEFIPYLEKIWASRFLTNGGSMHQALEQALCEYLEVEHIALFTNGTLALVCALQVLQVSGEVITTPYSFVASSHALLWNRLEPVFVDIDERSLNLDPSKIEAAITSRTTAILPVHCYGNPCEVEAIQRIADKHNLRVIYDAAHAFAVRDEGGSILRHGDLSVLSFHATKVFSTFEGGAIVCPDAETLKRINQLKNFGFVDEVTVVATGINGKMNEVSAAFGLLQLKHIDRALEQRRNIDLHYRELLLGLSGICCLEPTPDICANHTYFPILVGSTFPLSRDELYELLRSQGVMVRRYFYPLISDFPMYHDYPSAAPGNLLVAQKIAQEILCLPIYPGLTHTEVASVAALITKASQA